MDSVVWALVVFEHPLVLVVWSAAVATAAVFVWLAISNLASLRASNEPGLRLYAAFATFGAFDAALVVVSLVPMAPALKADVFRLMWVSGCLVVGLWMRSVAHFVGAGDHGVIRWLWRLIVIISATWVVDLAWAAAGGESLFFVLEPRETRSILLRAAGNAFRHRPLADALALALIVIMMVAAGTLSRLVRRNRPREHLLQFGIFVTATLGISQAALSGTDSAYNAPLLFMANLVEAMRITWASRARTAEQLAEVRRSQEEQAVLIDHQLEQLQLSKRLASLGEQTAEVTHDLRNPLGAVLAGLDLLELELDQAQPDVDQLRESLGLARNGLEHSLTLVKRITSQAKPIEAVPLRSLDLRALLDDSVSLCRPRTRGVQIELDVPPELSVVGSPVELTQVFTNLISNACEAMNELDELDPSHELGPRFVHIRGRPQGAQVRVEIEDAGPRPPDAIAAQMFKERFTTRASGEGTGLGLMICARIVKQHGGTIAVDPRAEHTTVVLNLQAGADDRA